MKFSIFFLVGLAASANVTDRPKYMENDALAHQALVNLKAHVSNGYPGTGNCTLETALVPQVGKSKQELFVINGTSRIRNHLEQKHQIDPQSGIKRKGSVRKSIIDQQKDGAASSIFFWK
ncbi:restless-like transposase, partial [Pyrenophora tritici-repentis]